MKLYGIKACDTCRKAMKELSNSGREVEFIDVRSNPPAIDVFEGFYSSLGVDLVNQRSKTWREMTDSDKKMPHVEMFQKFPTVMKRPVLVDGENITLGWSEKVRAHWIG